MITVIRQAQYFSCSGFFQSPSVARIIAITGNLGHERLINGNRTMGHVEALDVMKLCTERGVRLPRARCEQGNTAVAGTLQEPDLLGRSRAREG